MQSFGITPGSDINSASASDEATDYEVFSGITPRDFPPLPIVSDRALSQSPVFMKLRRGKGSGAITKTDLRKDDNLESRGEEPLSDPTHSSILKQQRGTKYHTKVPKVPVERKKPNKSKKQKEQIL